MFSSRSHQDSSGSTNVARVPNAAHIVSRNPSALWKDYHQAQLDGFSKLFGPISVGHWSCSELLREAGLRCQQLTPGDKAHARKQLRLVIKLRQRMLQAYPFHDPVVTCRHNYFIQTLHGILNCLRQDTTHDPWNDKTEIHLDKGKETAEAEPDSQPSKRDMDHQPAKSGSEDSTSPSIEISISGQRGLFETLDEDAISTFLESLSASVEAICNVSGQVAGEELEASSGTAVSIWLFRELSATLAVKMLTSVHWFGMLEVVQENISNTPFWQDLTQAKTIVRSFQGGATTEETPYFYRVIGNALRQPRGMIPLIHDLAVLLGDLSNASRQDNTSAKSFEASVYVLLLRRLRDQCDESQISTQKLALESRCERLNIVTSDSAYVRQLQSVGVSAIDITTIACLSTHAEANIQRLLCRSLGEPLIATVAHLYAGQRLEQQDAGNSVVLERICKRFSHLLFWNKIPLTKQACKDSIKNWIMDSEMRSLRPGRTQFFEERFENRNVSPLLVDIAEVLFTGKKSPPPGHRSTPSTKTSIVDQPTLSRLESDFHDFRALSMFVEAVGGCTNVGPIGSGQSRELAFDLSLRFLRDDNDRSLLRKIVSKLECFE